MAPEHGPPQGRRGVLEGASRVLAAVLASPRLQASVRLLLRELDPDNAPLLVRVAATTEPSLLVDVAAAWPRMLDAAAAAGDEAARRTLALPVGLVSAVVADGVATVDGRRLGVLLGRSWLVAARLLAAASRGGGLEDLGRDLLAGFEEALAEGGGGEERQRAWRVLAAGRAGWARLRAAAAAAEGGEEGAGGDVD